MVAIEVGRVGFVPFHKITGRDEILRVDPLIEKKIKNKKKTKFYVDKENIKFS